jgi:hypothetical protein
MAQPTAIGSHLYVLGEVEEPAGPVKIGMHESSRRGTGAAEMSRGNWRTLTVLHRKPVDLRVLRWSEWLIHRRLWSRHRRGEWFAVRDLVIDDDWERFLTDVLDNRIDELADWRLHVAAHELVRVERVGKRGDRRQFSAVCSCGFVSHGQPGMAFSNVQVKFARDHLNLSATDSAVRQLRWQVHHKFAHAPLPVL